MTYYHPAYNASSDESPSSFHQGFTIAKLPSTSLSIPDNMETNSASSSARCYKSSKRLSRSRLHKTVSDDSLAVRYRRMKCAVIVMTTLMIVASMLLVGVSLAMADHIDELVRQVSGLTTTNKPPERSENQGKRLEIKTGTRVGKKEEAEKHYPLTSGDS